MMNPKRRRQKTQSGHVESGDASRTPDGVIRPTVTKDDELSQDEEEKTGCFILVKKKQRAITVHSKPDGIVGKSHSHAWNVASEVPVVGSEGASLFRKTATGSVAIPQHERSGRTDVDCSRRYCYRRIR